MQIPRVYTSQSLSVDKSIDLEANPSHHISRVLRLKTSAAIVVFNGNGYEYQASIQSMSKSCVNIIIHAQQQPSRESNLNIRLGQGISRGERMDYTLQKSVELGVNHITPLWTRRTQVKLDTRRLKKRLQHWRGVIGSACEQSGRLVLPDLDSPHQLEHWCQNSHSEDLKLILDPEAAHKLTDLQLTTNQLSILIGPEGGLDKEEIALASSQGYTPVSLGPRILRTETAAVAALSAIQTLWGDFA